MACSHGAKAGSVDLEQNVKGRHRFVWTLPEIGENSVPHHVMIQKVLEYIFDQIGY